MILQFSFQQNLSLQLKLLIKLTCHVVFVHACTAFLCGLVVINFILYHVKIIIKYPINAAFRYEMITK